MTRLFIVVFCTALLPACAAVDADQAQASKERLACADVGLTPGSPSFGQCVADLRETLWADENPVR